MVDRFKVHHMTALDDVTGAMGAALLCFSSGTKDRRDSENYFSGIIDSMVNAESTPLLWRLAAARRLFLVVLDSSENPNATSLREIVSLHESTQDGIEEIRTGMEAMEEKILLALEEKLTVGIGESSKSKRKTKCKYGDACRRFQKGNCKY